MKKNFITRLLTIVSVVAVAMGTYSCSDDENTPPAENNVSFSATTAVPSGYSYGITNGANGNTYFVADANGDGTGEITKIGFVLPKVVRSDANVVNGIALFANQQVRSVTIDNVTYNFRSNENGKLDVTIVCNGKAQTIKDVAVSALLDNSDKGATKFQDKLKVAFAQISNATDLISLANEKIDEKSELKQEVQAIAQSVTGLKSDAKTLNNSETMEAVVNNVTNKPVSVDTTGIASVDSTAMNNTEIEYWPELPLDSTDVDVPFNPQDSIPYIPPFQGDSTNVDVPVNPQDSIPYIPPFQGDSTWTEQPVDTIVWTDSLSIRRYARRGVLRIY